MIFLHRFKVSDFTSANFNASQFGMIWFLKNFMNQSCDQIRFELLIFSLVNLNTQFTMVFQVQAKR